MEVIYNRTTEVKKGLGHLLEKLQAWPTALREKEAIPLVTIKKKDAVEYLYHQWLGGSFGIASGEPNCKEEFTLEFMMHDFMGKRQGDLPTLKMEMDEILKSLVDDKVLAMRVVKDKDDREVVRYKVSDIWELHIMEQENHI